MATVACSGRREDEAIAHDTEFLCALEKKEVDVRLWIEDQRTDCVENAFGGNHIDCVAISMRVGLILAARVEFEQMQVAADFDRGSVFRLIARDRGVDNRQGASWHRSSGWPSAIKAPAPSLKGFGAKRDRVVADLLCCRLRSAGRR